MKKISFLLAIFILTVTLAAMCAMTASAAEYVDPTVALEVGPVSDDGTFTVDVMVYNNPGIAGYQFDVVFDNSKIQLVDAVREWDEDYEEYVTVSAFPVTPTLNIDKITSSSFASCDMLSATAARATKSTKNGAYVSAVFAFCEGVYSADLKLENVLLVSEEKEAVEFDLVNATAGRPAPDFTGSCGDSLTYELYLDRGLLKIKGNGDMWDFDRQAPWDANEDAITTVEMADGVTSIGEYAFCGCDNLKNIAISENISKIGDNAFQNCNSLAAIEVDEGNANYCDIDGVLFTKDCKTLVAYPGGGAAVYSVPDSVTSIGDHAFILCKNLTSVTLPGSVTSIGYSAFSGCESLTNITLTDSITYIDSFAFFGCESIENITLPANITQINEYTFSGCVNLKEIIIPENVTSIGYFAFESCDSLTSVTIPANVGFIGTFAFRYCLNLESITFEAKNVEIEDLVFSGCSELKTVYLYRNSTADSYFKSSSEKKYMDIRTVTYVLGGGNGVFDSQMAKEYESITLHSFVPVKTGYDFKGWAGSDGKTYNAGDVYSGNADLILTAIWEEKTYSVIYTAGGGEDAPSTQTKYYFSDLTLSSLLPTKTGYNFKNWLGSDGKTYNAGDVYAENADLTLIAIWELKTYNVTYDANGGENAPENAVKEHFASYTISSVIPTKIGYDFKGWSGSDGKTYNVGDVYTEEADLTLTAIWEIKTYNVVYDANGGENAPENTVKEHFASYTISSVAPTKIGYNFKGWLGSDGKTYNAGDVYAENADLTLIAIWELKTYNVTYDANGGENAPENAVKEHFASYTISSVVPTKIGYDFKGWSGSDGKTYNAGDVYSGNADLTLTAKWELTYVVMTYDPNGGSVSETSKSVQYTTAIGEMAEPIKKGYTFDGWYTEKDGGELVTAETVVDTLDDFTVYAHWTANTYKASLDANGGIVSTLYTSVTFDSTYGILPEPTYTGYKFEGWYTEKDGGELVTSGSVVAIDCDHTLYARWKANVYLVSFDANGGECDRTMTEVTFNSAYGSLPVPTRTGYTFVCWSKSETAEDIVTKDSIHTQAHEITLYAIWAPRTYTLTFDALGGDLEIAKKTVTFDAPYGTLPTSTMANYVFGGWFLEKEYANKITSETIVSTAEDHTVYAMWIPLNYTIIYNANGGEGAPEQQTKEYGTDATLSDVEPTRKGYHFKGWSTTADGVVVYAPGAVYSENANLTLYAVWEAINYGDPSGDGEINAVDAVLLAQKIAGWDVELDISAADCNGDGEVNAIDAVLLAQFIAGWDVVLG